MVKLKALAVDYLTVNGKGEMIYMINLSGEYAKTYVVEGQIGSGGGGTIYKAFHTRLEKTVVLKKIHENGSYDLAEVRREVDILKNLRNTYLPQVLDFLELDTGIFTVMDYIPGKSVQDYLDAGYKFSEKEITHYGKQLAEALAYLHTQKPAIIHGDIKPANVMITPEKNVCLIDFNISGIAENADVAYVMGLSEDYAAPEQIDEYLKYINSYSESASAPEGELGNTVDKTTVLSADAADKTAVLSTDAADKTTVLSTDAADKTAVLSTPGPVEVFSAEEAQASSTNDYPGIPVTTKSDVYSLGATLYHMLVGRTVSKDKEKRVLVDANEGFCMILNKALDSNPQKRYADASEMLKAFRNMYKMDKRYRRIQLRHQLIQCLFIILMAVGVLLLVLSRSAAGNEKSSEYIELVQAMDDARMAADATAFEEYYQAAVNLMPEGYDAYVEKAFFIYSQGDAADYIDFLEKDILANKPVVDRLVEESAPQLARLYELEGRCYSKLNDENNAVKAYQNAILYDETQGSYYVDEAIAYVRLGNSDEAQKALNSAEKTETGKDLVALAEGEMAIASEDYETAEKKLAEALDLAHKTDDEDAGYTLSQIYTDLAGMYQAQADMITVSEEDKENGQSNPDVKKKEELLKKEIEVLEKGTADSKLGSDIILNQYLVMAYGNLYNLNGDKDTLKAAAGLMEKNISSGFVEFASIRSLVGIYEEIGDLDAAEKLLNKVGDKFSNDYSYYLCLAFLELEKQSAKSGDYDFSAFKEYFDKTMELVGDINDTQIVVLKKQYEDLVAGGFMNE